MRAAAVVDTETFTPPPSVRRAEAGDYRLTKTRSREINTGSLKSIARKYMALRAIKMEQIKF